MFYRHSYCSGASILRMLRCYVGEEPFDRAVNAYLRRFQYKNAVTADLWDCISEATGVEVADIMFDELLLADMGDG